MAFVVTARFLKKEKRKKKKTKTKTKQTSNKLTN